MIRSFAASWRSIITSLLSLGLLLSAFWISGSRDFLDEFLRFPWWTILGVLLLFGLNLGLVTYRLGRILSSFGVVLPSETTVRASLAGHLAGLFFISLFGQVMGRHLVLDRHGVPSMLIAAVTAYERAALLLVSGSLCAAGVIMLLGQFEVTNFLTDISAPQIVITALTGLLLSLAIGRTRFEARSLKLARSSSFAAGVLETTGITVFAQLLVLGAFVLGALALEPDIGILKLIAAAAVISFASSIPITVNGWGLREVASIYAFGQLGIPSSSALAISVLIGITSTIAILIAAPLAIGKKPRQQRSLDLKAVSPQEGIKDLAKIATWLATTAATVLIFFQMHISISGDVMNINLADPLAMLMAAAVAMHIISTRQPPHWRTPKFNLMLAAISLLLIFAFARGAMAIGVTQWALSGRLMGWLVLLGYLGIGYLTAAYLGSQGIRRLVETMVSTAAAIVAIQMMLRWLTQYDLLGSLHMSFNFEGHAGNRNAFAFQMLICSALAIGYSSRYQRLETLHERSNKDGSAPSNFIYRIASRNRLKLFALLHAFIITGVVFSASRAGLITGGLLLLTAWLMRYGSRRFLTLSASFALLLWILPQVNWLYPFGHENLGLFFEHGAVQSNFSTEASNHERWTSIVKGLELWLQSPIIGAGLGTFIEMSTSWLGRPLVIHSTPVWILTELGLIGALVLSWAFAAVLIQSFKLDNRTECRTLVMILLVFAVFCQAHEIFYQRIFWLAVGAMLTAHGYSPPKNAADVKSSHG